MDGRVIAFYETNNVIKIIDSFAKDSGTSRSDFIRVAVRRELQRIMEARGIKAEA